MPEVEWIAVRSRELVEAFENKALHDLLGRRSAVYMWKLALRPNLLGQMDTTALLDFIDGIMRTPYAVISPRRLSHFARFEGLRFVGPGLPPEKRAQLKGWSDTSPSKRRWLQTYLQSLASHAPALYVGETGRLCARVEQHMSGETDFGAAVLANDWLSWALLDLHFVNLGSETSEESALRKALEYIAAVVSIGGLTTRPG